MVISILDFTTGFVLVSCSFGTYPPDPLPLPREGGVQVREGEIEKRGATSQREYSLLVKGEEIKRVPGKIKDFSGCLKGIRINICANAGPEAID